MNLFNLAKPKRITLRLVDPDETLYERCYRLVLLITEQKKELKALKAENAQLLDHLNQGRSLSAEQVELMHWRTEVDELWQKNERLKNKLTSKSQENRYLRSELERFVGEQRQAA
jgi:chromosome segregation ATPase